MTSAARCRGPPVLENATHAVAKIRLTDVERCLVAPVSHFVQRRRERGKLLPRDVGALRTAPHVELHAQFDFEEVDIGPHDRDGD